MKESCIVSLEARLGRCNKRRNGPQYTQKRTFHLRLAGLQLRAHACSSESGGSNGPVEIVTIWNVFMPKRPGLLL